MPTATSLAWLLLWMQIDSVPLAAPHWIATSPTRTLPRGPEVLAQSQQGDTLRLLVRFWEGPGQVEWYWGQDTYRTAIYVPALPPDSLMPLADFTIPHQELSPEASTAPSWEWIGIALALLMVSLLLGRFFLHSLRTYGEALWQPLRWQLFLWRWRPKKDGDFRAFLAAVKVFLRPYATFHPGALTPTEAQQVQGPPALRALLRRLVEVEYSEGIFWGGRFRWSRAFWSGVQLGRRYARQRQRWGSLPLA